MSISNEQMELLQDVLGERQPDLLPLLDEAASGRELSAAEANEIREVIGKELAESGVDHETGAVNDRGRALDDLIDLVASLSELRT